MRSIYVDWSRAYGSDIWDFVGRSVLREKEQDEDSDRGYPMMNYAYPLDYFNGDETIIKRIVRETNCTVVYNTQEDTYYLALTGGGMDLSQDIAKAYMIAQGYIEWDMLHDVSINGPLSVSPFWYRKILRELKRQFAIEIANAQSDLNRVNELLSKKAA